MFGKKPAPPPRSRPVRPVRAAAARPARGGAGADETVVLGPSASGRSAPPSRARLVDLCAEWLGLIVAMRQAPSLPDAAGLRARALELKARLEDDARRGGFSAADAETAVFALVGFTDETVLRGQGPARDAWLTRPLQLELYGAMLAGEEFFDRLDRLRREREARIEALEVYYACLAFGFAGKFLMAGPERIKSLLVEVEQDVAAVRGTGRRALAPHAARSDEAGGAVAGAGLAWWVAPVGFVGAVLVTWILIKLFSMLGAGGDASAIRRALEGIGR